VTLTRPPLRLDVGRPRKHKRNHERRQAKRPAKPHESKGKCAFKDGSAAKRHPFYKGAPITVDHLNGKDGAVFIKAIKHLDALAVKAGKQKEGDGWFDRHIVQK
jgi:hypothetical protein